VAVRVKRRSAAIAEAIAADLGGFAVLLGAILLLVAIGAAAIDSALTPDRTDLFQLPLGVLASTVTPSRVVTVMAILMFALLLLRKHTGNRALVATFVAALAFAVYGITLSSWFAPPDNWGQQWQTTYSTSGNLTEGVQLAANLREGHGYKLDDGSVDTYRMPGYAVVVAAAGAAGGAHARDFRSVAEDTIWAQIILTAAALGVFTFAAAKRFRRPVLLSLVFVLVSLPTNFQFTQGDSMMFAAGLLVTAALLPFLDRPRGGDPPWRDVILLHLAFASYFLLRTDVAIAWAVVSLIVHWRRWQHLAVWLVLFVAVGAGFGAYSRANGSEFTFGTNNTGHVAFVGLWELPQDRFVWQPSDGSYDQWISLHHHVYRGSGTNAFAEKEIARFYATFPGYITSMSINKALDFFDSTSLDVDYQRPPFAVIHQARVALVNGVLWVFAGAMLLALVAGYRRYQTVLLGWAGLFVLPLFFFVQDESRFTLFEVASLAIAGVPILLDPDLYRRLAARWAVAAPLVAVLVTVWLARSPIRDGLLHWDGFRYWAPLLDPRDSTLAVYHR
jgi:hypothetical protein